MNREVATKFSSERNMAKNALGFSIKKSSGNRNAYRAKISGLNVKITGRPAVYSAKDLSPTGVGLSGSTGLREGAMLEVGLYFKGALVAGNLKARVMRATATFTGLLFINPDRRQADAVHALVLKEQKRQAELRKKEKLKKS